MIVGSGEDSLKQTVERLKAAHVDLDPDFDGCITVSFDGSWHKRGHTSKYGLGVVIDALTGLVIAHEVLSKYCHAYNWNKTVLGEHSVQFLEWQASHNDCSVNYSGSSKAMEVEVAIRLWKRSEKKASSLMETAKPSQLS